jgi:hypothetical protein
MRSSRTKPFVIVRAQDVSQGGVPDSANLLTTTQLGYQETRLRSLGRRSYVRLRWADVGGAGSAWTSKSGYKIGADVEGARVGGQNELKPTPGEAEVSH